MGKALPREKGPAVQKPLPAFWEVQCAATELSGHTSRMSIAVRRASLFLDLFCTFARNACKGKNKSEAKKI